MDVKWLDDFLVLAECRSFTRAARLRNTSQSGLSRRIQSLEQWIGSPLVDRETARFGLTEAGQRFLPLATHLRNAVVAARELCGPVRAPHPASCVTLAVAEGLESGVLPQLLSRLKLQGFDAPVRVVVKGAQAAAVALLDGDADLWLAPQHPQLPLMLDPMSYEAATVAHDRLSPIVATNGFGRALYALPGLRDAPTPLLEYGMADYLSQVVGVVMASAPLRACLRPVAGSDSLHSLCTLVRQGLGLAFLPESMVREELRRGELVRADARWSALLEIRLVRAGRAFPRSPADAAQRMWRCLVDDDHCDTAMPLSCPPARPVHEACPLGR
jgi:DNA-binding transcriptional LysR family regulator